MKLILNVIFAFFLISCDSTQEIVTTNPVFTGVAQETVFTDRGIIWGFDFLPNNDIIFTEKSGKVGLFSKNAVTELTGLPSNISSDNQGGLLDICLHPKYTTNNWIYASYSDKEGYLNLIRFKIDGNTIKNVENIFKTSSVNKWKGHYGSRIIFDKKDFLYLSVGEGGISSYGGEKSPNQNVQNVKEAWGKIHRMSDTGKVPADNPMLEGTISTIYAYGIRNPQGLVLNTDTDQIWETEHGPKGGDELNLISKGKNYGWPLVSMGVNYDGTAISSSHNRTGIENPVHSWSPSIGACGLAYISSTKYGDWKGSFIAGGLALRNLSRVDVKGSNILASTIIENAGRVRNVKLGPDGYLYLSIEGPGRIVKLLPK